jgi:hypothetical protein
MSRYSLRALVLGDAINISLSGTKDKLVALKTENIGIVLDKTVYLFNYLFNYFTYFVLFYVLKANGPCKWFDTLWIPAVITVTFYVLTLKRLPDTLFESMTFTRIIVN